MLKKEGIGNGVGKIEIKHNSEELLKKEHIQRIGMCFLRINEIRKDLEKIFIIEDKSNKKTNLKNIYFTIRNNKENILEEIKKIEQEMKEGNYDELIDEFVKLYSLEEIIDFVKEKEEYYNKYFLENYKKEEYNLKEEDMSDISKVHYDTYLIFDMIKYYNKDIIKEIIKVAKKRIEK